MPSICGDCNQTPWGLAADDAIGSVCKLGLNAIEEESTGADRAFGLKDICTEWVVPGGPGVPGIPCVMLNDGVVGTHEVVGPTLGADDRAIVGLEEVEAVVDEDETVPVSCAIAGETVCCQQRN